MNNFERHMILLKLNHEALREASSMESEEISSTKKISKIIEETIVSSLACTKRGWLRKNLMASNEYNVNIYNKQSKTHCLALCDNKNKEFSFVLEAMVESIRNKAELLHISITKKLVQAWTYSVVMHEFRHSQAINIEMTAAWELSYRTDSDGWENECRWLEAEQEIDADAYALHMLYDWLEE